MPIKQHMPERRSETRLLCADMVEVSWKERSGQTGKSMALLEDISACGACLQFDAPVPLQSQMRVIHTKGRLDGTVVYCVFRETGYFVGLRFAGDRRWSRQVFKPQHLLDVRRLVMRRASRALKRSITDTIQ